VLLHLPRATTLKWVHGVGDINSPGLYMRPPKMTVIYCTLYLSSNVIGPLKGTVPFFEKRSVIGRYGLHNGCSPCLPARDDRRRRVWSAVIRTECARNSGRRICRFWSYIWYGRNPGSFLSACRVISGRRYFLDSRFSDT